MNLDRAVQLLSRLHIKHRDQGTSFPFRLNYNQQLAVRYMREQQESEGYIRACFLKARRVGVSSLIDALLTTYCMAYPQAHAEVVAHEFKTSELGLFRVPHDLAEELNAKFKIASVRARRIYFHHEDGDSLMDIATAGSVGSGRGLTLNALHLCLSPESLVLSEDGNMIPVSEVQAGTKLWTHNGFPTTAKVVTRRPVLSSEKVFELRTWMNFETVRLTGNHEVFTSRGWIAAENLQKHDEIGIGRRRFSGTLKSLDLLRLASKGPFTIKGQLPLTRETGFFVGYYLAEGWMQDHSLSHLPSRIGFAMHPKNIRFSERALRSVGGLYSSHRYSAVRKALTIRLVLQGASLAALIDREFGRCHAKKIPDWIYDAPREFAEGIVLGYLAGDGSKTLRKTYYDCPSIYVTSVRPRLLYQLRELLGSLGWGWGGITFEKGFIDKRGWNNRDSWTMTISGDAAIELRKKLGLDAKVESDPERRERAMKYRIDSDHIWVRLRSVTPAFSPEVCDVEVNHPDHSFEMVIGAVSNSEAAQYPPITGSFLSLLPAVSKGPNTMVAVESTAYGKVGDGEAFYEFWRSACARRDTPKWNGYIPIFLDWLHDPACVRSEDEASDAPATDLERELMKKPFLANRAQIAWMRRTMEAECGGEETKWLQEFPHAPEVAFQSTGDPAFPRDEMIFAERTKREPRYCGRIVRHDRAPHFESSPRGPLLVWEKPQPQCYYYIGADAAAGYETGDFAALAVYNGTTGTQSARFTDHASPEELAEQCDLLGRWYNNGMVNIELTGNLGRWAQKRLRDEYVYPNIYRWRGKDDKLNPNRGRSNSAGWETNNATRGLLREAFRERLRQGMKNQPGGLEIYDAELVTQMENATMRNTAKWEVVRGHDDILIAWMLAVVTCAQYPPPNVFSYRANYMTKQETGFRSGLAAALHQTPQADLQQALKRDLAMILRPEPRRTMMTSAANPSKLVGGMAHGEKLVLPGSFEN